MPNRRFRLFAVLASLWLAGAAQASETLDNFFLLHHSTGRNLISEGSMRAWFAAYDAHHGTAIRFWDHDYNYIGLNNAEGENLGYYYGHETGNTDPDGLHILWTTANAARDSILNRHDVIAFKSCFPASGIASDAQLQQYRDWYLAMRDVFDQRPDKVFIVMSTPPLHRLATDLDDADRARSFASWLASPAYLQGHPNVVCFDLFDQLAHADDGSSVRNMLRYEYEESHSSSDSHPNETANAIVGPLLAAFFVEAAALIDLQTEVPGPGGAGRVAVYPNPCNPATTIEFRLDERQIVDLRIFDLHGRLVSTLAAGESLDQGLHRRTWHGRDREERPAPAGVYLCRLRTAAGTQVRPVTVVE
ncbi:MAG TPA: T9SS type A sorting domain-containing protein [Candidatus Krumholzibacteria bacterium]|nr:T9SS type A sorting domain-containing protein [Candidatus Krumholzibacteria bacterium]HPD72023.1 T9SS type A sorting domain-containing protein [Candidatus Krumholzibacteria bacterium]HRY41044.1 T9SS type A sorting domain-containing protein [Candidatus Krumholzibacteria bacterium]